MLGIVGFFYSDVQTIGEVDSLISWHAGKKKIMAQSSTKVEYISL